MGLRWWSVACWCGGRRWMGAVNRWGPAPKREPGSERSIQQLGVVRRLRRCLDRDRLDLSADRFCAAMCCPLGDDDEVAGLHRDLFVTEPDRTGALQNVLDLVGVGMHVLG